MDPRDSASRISCPHCGQPLEVAWEVYREWQVVRDADGNPILSGEPVRFEGGTCVECEQWVEPKDIKP